MKRSKELTPITILGVYLVLAHRAIFDLSLGPRVILEPWLLNNGFVVYRDIVDQHESAMPMLLSLFLPLLGNPLLLAKWVLIGLLVTTAGLTYWVGKNLFGWRAGLLASLFFVLWEPLIIGGKLWYEVFLMPLYIAAFGLWPGNANTSSRRVFCAGLTLGIAVLFKQLAWAPVGTYFIWIVYLTLATGTPIKQLPLRLTGWFSLGIAIPVALNLLYLNAINTFDYYMQWAWTNNLNYQGQAGLAPTPNELLTVAVLFLPFGALAAFRANHFGRLPMCLREDILLLLLAVSASLSAYPRFAFFHFAAALPLLSLTLAATFESAWRPAFEKLGYTGFSARLLDSSLGSLLALTYAIGTVFSSAWVLVPTYKGELLGPGPQRIYEYDDLLIVSEMVKNSTSPDERVYLFPDDEGTANVYYLSQRLPPGFWTFTYPWYMTDESMQLIIGHLESQSVRTIVYFDDRGTDGKLAKDYAATLSNYLISHYEPKESISWSQGTAHIMTRIEPSG